MNGWAIFLILILVVVVFGFGGLTAYRHYQARRLGLPAPPLNPFAHSGSRSTSAPYAPPAPARGGIGGWLSSRISALRNPRSATGGYEASSASGYGSRRARGFDPLDPDGAWDTRVGNEADYGVGPSGAGREGYYEEQELGIRHGGGVAAVDDVQGTAYGGADGRGRSRDRDGRDELDTRYDAEMGRANPFDDTAAERSDLRGVSPRPVEGHDRRSAFREDM